MFIKFAKAKLILGENDRPDLVDLSKYNIEKEPGFFYFAAWAVSEGINENHDYFSADELRENYKTFDGVPLFLNHQSDDVSKAVGKVIRAYLIEEIPVWVKTICAVDEKNHPDIADKIRRGIITDVSMGCYVNETVCSVCGNVARDEFGFCEHIKTLKGTLDPETKKEIFEICRGIQFYELSLVTSGADPQAQVLELLASPIESSLEAIKNLPAFKPELPEGLYLYKEFNDDSFPAFVLAKKNGEIKYLPIAFFQSFRVPGRWVDSEEEALKQLKLKGINAETKLAYFLDNITMNPRLGKLIEPIYNSYREKAEPTDEDRKFLLRIMANGIPVSSLTPSEALSVWNQLKEACKSEVFKIGDFVKWQGRIGRIISNENGIAEIELSNGKNRKVVEYMLSKTFPPAKRAVFEKYLEISGKTEDEAYDAFVNGKELEFDKENALKAYREIIGDEIEEGKIAGLAVFLSRKPWLDFDKISDTLKQGKALPIKKADEFDSEIMNVGDKVYDLGTEMGADAFEKIQAEALPTPVQLSNDAWNRVAGQWEKSFKGGFEDGWNDSLEWAKTHPASPQDRKKKALTIKVVTKEPIKIAQSEEEIPPHIQKAFDLLNEKYNEMGLIQLEDDAMEFKQDMLNLLKRTYLISGEDARAIFDEWAERNDFYDNFGDVRYANKKIKKSVKSCSFILKFANPSKITFVKRELAKEGKLIRNTKDTCVLKVPEYKSKFVKKFLLNIRKEYGFTLMPYKAYQAVILYIETSTEEINNILTQVGVTPEAGPQTEPDGAVKVKVNPEDAEKIISILDSQSIPYMAYELSELLGNKLPKTASDWDDFVNFVRETLQGQIDDYNRDKEHYIHWCGEDPSKYELVDLQLSESDVDRIAKDWWVDYNVEDTGWDEDMEEEIAQGDESLDYLQQFILSKLPLKTSAKVKTKKKAQDIDEIENHARQVAEANWEGLVDKASNIWIEKGFFAKGDENIVEDNIEMLFLGLRDSIDLNTFEIIGKKNHPRKAQLNPAYSAGLGVGGEFAKTVLANECNKYPDRESRIYFVGEFLNSLSDIFGQRKSEIIEMIKQKLLPLSEAEPQKIKVKAKDDDSKWFNPDGTFKGGFEGCVDYFMSKPDFKAKDPNDTKREGAEKLCAYINRQKGGSQRVLAEIALKSPFIKKADIKFTISGVTEDEVKEIADNAGLLYFNILPATEEGVPVIIADVEAEDFKKALDEKHLEYSYIDTGVEELLSQKEAQEADPAADGFDSGKAFGEQSFEYFANCFEEAIQGLEYSEYRDAAQEFDNGMFDYYTSSIEPQLNLVIPSHRVPTKTKKGEESLKPKKAYGKNEGKDAMANYSDKYVNEVKNELGKFGYTAVNATAFVDGFWDGFIEYIYTGLVENIGSRWYSKKAVDSKNKPFKKAQDLTQDVLDRLFEDAESGIVTVEGLECKFHYEKGAFSEVHLIPTPEAKQTDSYQQEKQRLGDDWFFVFTDSEDMVNYALQAAQANGHSRSEYEVIAKKAVYGTKYYIYVGNYGDIGDIQGFLNSLDLEYILQSDGIVRIEVFQDYQPVIESLETYKTNHPDTTWTVEEETGDFWVGKKAYTAEDDYYAQGNEAGETAAEEAMLRAQSLGYFSEYPHSAEDYFEDLFTKAYNDLQVPQRWLDVFQKGFEDGWNNYMKQHNPSTIWSLKKSKPQKLAIDQDLLEQCFLYLDNLQELGADMEKTAPSLQSIFSLDEKTAKDVLAEWMLGFKKGNPDNSLKKVR